MFHQISIYTENKKGAMKQVLSLLSAGNINVLGLITNDSGEFGTIRLIVSDTDAALKTLGTAGYLCRTTRVIGIELSDRPGALEQLLDTIDKMNINVDYVYVGFLREKGVPLIMLHCEDLDIVYSQLESMKYTVH